MAIFHFLSHPKVNNKRSPKAVVHISSIAGQVTPMHAPIYNAAKHGINGFVRSLAPLSKRLNIRVTAVAPGVIDTPMWRENPEKFRFLSESDTLVEPKFVADVMTSLVENEKVEVSTGSKERTSNVAADITTGDAREGTNLIEVEGGLILEVAKDKVRVVEQFNDPGYVQFSPFSGPHEQVPDRSSVGKRLVLPSPVLHRDFGTNANVQRPQAERRG